jgi:hypothetical protein
MSAAESWRPRAASGAHAKIVARPATNVVALRARGPSRNLKDERRVAREREQELIGGYLSAVPDETMATLFGASPSSPIGSGLKAGGVAMTPGELALLVPLGPSLRSQLALLRERLEREAGDLTVSLSDPRQVKVRLALQHIDALGAFLTGL